MLLEARPLDRVVPSARGSAPAVLAGCLAVAALTLLLPSTPTYDPWAWIIWGREIAQLDLVTTTGPSWKPLPALFTVPFSLFGSAAPWLWLIVARAGALVGLVYAFRVARRLGGDVAGAAVVGALVLAPWYVKNAALGNSEGLMAAAVLGAVDRHLAGHRRQAFGLGLAAALLRPEAWPFFGLYGLWLIWRERTALALVAAGFASLPVLWLGPELWGSGNLNRASDRAQDPNPNSPAFAEHPALEVLGNALDMLTVPVLTGLALVIVALVTRRRRGAEVRAVAALAALAAAWLGLVAYMTSNGFSGNQRYLVMPVTLAVLVGAVGIGWLVETVLARARGWARPALAVMVAVVFTAPYWSASGGMWSNLAYQGNLQADLERTVNDAGGAERLLRCGRVATGAFLVPAVAWQLSVHAQEVTLEPRRPGVVLRVSTVPGSNPVPSLRTLGPGPVEELAQHGHWRALGACG